MWLSRIIKLLKRNIFYRRLHQFYRFLFPGIHWLELRRRADVELPSGNFLKHVLFATSIGSFSAVALESLLATALNFRHCKTSAVLCGGALSACLECMKNENLSEREFLKSGPKRFLCPECYAFPSRVLNDAGVSVLRYEDFLSPEDRKKIETIVLETAFGQVRAYQLNGVQIGEHAYAGALRFYARGNLERELNAPQILVEYFKSALITFFAFERLLEQCRVDCVVIQHGIYVPQGIIGEVCRKRGVRLVSWSPAYRKGCFIFSHNDTYHHTLMDEPSSNWEHFELTPERENQLLEYIRSRRKGTQDWIWFHENPSENADVILKEMGVDVNRPLVGLLTNVAWDAQLHYPANAFRDMFEWLKATVEYFMKRADLQLVIRVHPAEIRGTLPSRQKVCEELKRMFPHLPKNIFVIAPEENVSTYAVMEKCCAVIIYGTKTGVELSSFGIPVIVAGEAWIRNKNITIDIADREEYFRVLDSLPDIRNQDPDNLLRARKYAYHFFFRRMIPLACMQPSALHRPYKIKLECLSQLLPGQMPGLDVICDGIINGLEFIYPAEVLGPAGRCM